MNNLYQILQPKTREEWVDMLKAYLTFNPDPCGIDTYPVVVDAQIKLPKRLICPESTFTVNSTLHDNVFSYYSLSNRYPGGIVLNNVVMEENKINVLSEMILECTGGVYY